MAYGGKGSVNNPIFPEAEDFHPAHSASEPNSLIPKAFRLSSWHSGLPLFLPLLNLQIRIRHFIDSFILIVQREFPMYGLPDSFDGALFIGRDLIMIAFAPNSVHFYFTDSVSIVVESAIEYSSLEDKSKITHQMVPIASSSVMHLVGSAVELCKKEGKGTLVLQFKGGSVLKCIENESGYESYQFGNGNSTIYV